jgi:hypothetical protein
MPPRSGVGGVRRQSNKSWRLGAADSVCSRRGRFHRTIKKYTYPIVALLSLGSLWKRTKLQLWRIIFNGDVDVKAVLVRIDNDAQGDLQVEIDIQDAAGTRRSTLMIIPSSSQRSLAAISVNEQDLISDEEAEYWRSCHMWGL